MNAKSFGFILFASLVSGVPGWGQSQRSLEPQSRQGDSYRWIVILREKPLSEQFVTRTSMASAQGMAARRRIELEQQDFSARLAQMKIRRMGSVDTLLNAVFVHGTRAQADAIRAMPGVEGVVPTRLYRRRLNRAGDLVNAAQGWGQIGGQDAAGLGRRIGIIDTGIDISHPAFQDDSLPPVAGGPFCSGRDCDYTNRKVIAARSYVEQLVYLYEGDTRADDLSPRDRVGHGTALAMVAAGRANASPLGNITGIAPKAYLGVYKVYGSPGVNDLTSNDVIITAMNDAFRDGMDVINLSLGSAAGWGPEDQGPTCNLSGTSPCDPLARAVKNASELGLTVVVSGGNSGDAGQVIPAYNSIESPGTESKAITVGATTNSHVIFQTVAVTGDAPAGLAQINGRFGDGPVPPAPITLPLRDVSRLGDNGQACGPLANGSLNDALALIDGGGCALRTKVINAQNAGARGVVFARSAGLNSVFAPVGLAYTGIPLILIGNSDGTALREFIAGNPDRPVTIDPALREVYDPQRYADFIAIFSSYGPSIRLGAIKPELVAPGTDLVTATQSYDPNGDMFSATRYTVIDGTSFSAPMVAGAVALVRQKNPSWGPDQLKSAVVNTASPQIDDFDNNDQIIAAGARAMGAGKLQLDAALRTNVTVFPTTVSFGTIQRNATTLPSVGLTFRNHSDQVLTLALQVVARESDTRARVALSTDRFTLQPGATSSPVTVRLDGSAPNPGSYEGVIAVEGGAVPLRIPFLYIVGDGVPANVLPMANYDFEGVTNSSLPGGFLFKVVDRYGVPVPNLNVQWRVLQGGANLADLIASRSTDDLGIADASRVILGPQSGLQVFEATIAQVPEPLTFVGTARIRPTIETGGIVNGASFERGRPVAPGSWVTIIGQGLADAPQPFSTPYIPIAIGNISVSVDLPTGRQSYAARLSYVSNGQVNVQLPWELQGQTNALLKVSIGDFSSPIVSFNIANFSPAPFQYQDSSGRMLVVATPANSTEVIGSARPADRGSVITIYANGLGPVTNTPPTGEPARSSPLSTCLNTTTVTFGGRPGNVQFCGLTPGTAGLHQLNVMVPADAPTDLQDVVLTVNGVSSTPVRMPIR